MVGFSFGTLFSVSAPLVADCFGLTFVAYGFVAGPLGPTLSGYLLAGLCIRQVVPSQRA